MLMVDCSTDKGLTGGKRPQQTATKHASASFFIRRSFSARTRIFYNAPLLAVMHLQPFFPVAPSTIMGMCGASGGRHPAVEKPTFLPMI